MTTATEQRIVELAVGSDADDDDDEDDDVFLPTDGGRAQKSDRSKTKPEQSTNTGALTAMERLVRVHPIWYLPHIGRTAAANLLRGKENGNFIVRQSTKSNLMALTVKVPRNNEADQVEHYLIEITVAGVRLEGSPNTFSALPFLLAYYMSNGDELECQLHLPSAIKRCQNRRELYSYAILGQKFWTNNFAQSPSWSSPVSYEGSTKLYGRSASSSLAEGAKRREGALRSDVDNDAVKVQPVSRGHSLNDGIGVSVRRAKTNEATPMVESNGVQRRRGGSLSSSPSKLLTFKPEKCDASLCYGGSGSAILLKRAKLRSMGSSFRPAFNLLRREKSDLGWCYSSANATTVKSAQQYTVTTSQSSLTKKYSYRRYATGSPANSCPRSLNVNNANFKNCVNELKRCQEQEEEEEEAQPNPRKSMDKSATTTAIAQSSPLRKKSHNVNHVCRKNVSGKRLSAPGNVEANQENGAMKEVMSELKSRQLTTADVGACKIRLNAINEAQALDRRSRSLETVVKDTASLCTFAKRLRSAITATKGKEAKATAVDGGGGRSIFHVTMTNDELRKDEKRALLKPCEYAMLRYSNNSTMQKDKRGAMKKEELDDSRSVESVAATVFSEPWDSSMWENLITIATSMGPTQTDEQPSSSSPRAHGRNGSSTNSRIRTIRENDCTATSNSHSLEEEGSGDATLTSEGGSCSAPPTCTDSLSSLSSASKSSKQPSNATHERFVDQLNSFSISESDSEEMLSIRARMQRHRSRQQADSSRRIQSCVVRLAQNTNTFVGAQLQSFIRCTIEAQETDPHVVLGNVRQFINGLKNYLVKQGEVSLHSLIEAERSNLRPTEFLNIDAILENVLQKVVLPPLKAHIYQTLVRDGSKNGSLEMFSENMAILRAKSPAELGIADASLNASTLDRVRGKLRSMQRHYSPLRKLEFLLDAVYVVYETNDGREMKLPAVDELVRLLVFLLAKCSVVGCEIEADYIWGLLHPALLFGEASYYLTALSSAVHILKHIDLLPKLKEFCPFAVESIETAGAFLRIAIPDEISGAIHYHCFPALPQMSAARLCRMIAHKFGITNPEDHGIYLIVDEFESCLLPSELPEMVKEQLRAAGKPHMFVYKRHEAKIAWPKVSPSPKFR